MILHTGCGKLPSCFNWPKPKGFLMAAINRHNALGLISVCTLSVLLTACGGGDAGSPTSGDTTTTTTPITGTGVAPTTNPGTSATNSTPVPVSSGFASCAQIKSPQEALDAINQARAVGRNCGGTFFPAVAPLAWNDQLANAALAHSKDMAVRNFFDHTNPDGETPFDRTAKAGYGRFTGENIAAGYGTLDAVMKGWLSSAGHCANIMRKEYRDAALACYVPASNTAAYGIYWTQNFGAK
jgi:uncharacterized protein YkwD